MRKGSSEIHAGVRAWCLSGVRAGVDGISTREITRLV
jgi:hypothetical protein